jgi:nitroreductase
MNDSGCQKVINLQVQTIVFLGKQHQGLLIIINMDALEAILNRRSIRKYTTQPVSNEQLETILKSAMYAPSAVNKQPWHFIVFRDPQTIRMIQEAHPSSGMLSKASVGILVCYDEHLQHDTGYGPVDCSAATENMLLAAHSIGLGAVWVGIYPRQPRMDAVQKIFNLPAHVKGFAIVSIGYPDETKTDPGRFDKSRIHTEKW